MNDATALSPWQVNLIRAHQRRTDVILANRLGEIKENICDKILPDLNSRRIISVKFHMTRANPRVALPVERMMPASPTDGVRWSAESLQHVCVQVARDMGITSSLPSLGTLCSLGLHWLQERLKLDISCLNVTAG